MGGAGYLLGRIVDEDRKLNPSPMISSLVIYLNANDAGSGFYAKARKAVLFQDGMEKDEFWIRRRAFSGFAEARRVARQKRPFLTTKPSFLASLQCKWSCCHL